MIQHDLRIAILCPGYGRVIRGVETFTGELAGRLLDIQPEWRIDIYCRGAHAEPSPGIRQIHVPAVDRDSRAATFYARLGHRFRMCLRTRIDAECLSFTLALAPRFLRARYDVIFNQAGPFAGRLLQMKRRLDGTPFIHKTASGYAELELIMARQRPDAIVATSPFVGEWLEQCGVSPRVECIPNAVDCSLFRPYAAPEIEPSRDGLAVFSLGRPVVLFVGAMEPMKRPELLLSAVAALPEASLAMVGSGRLSDSVVGLGVKLLGKRFLHVACVPRDQMALYYNACDVFTLPSEEPFGIAFLEAMACNKPVLGHRSPVQQWIFGDAGTTCDCTNVHEYASAIRRLLATDFGDRPRERSRGFDWAEIVPKYADLFSQVAAVRGS